MLPEQPQPHWGVRKHQPVLQQLHLHSKSERSTSKIKIQKAEKVGVLEVGLLVWVLVNREEILEKGSPPYSPVHHTTFQF